MTSDLVPLSKEELANVRAMVADGWGEHDDIGAKRLLATIESRDAELVSLRKQKDRFKAALEDEVEAGAAREQRFKELKEHVHAYHSCDFWVDPVFGPEGCDNL